MTDDSGPSIAEYALIVAAIVLVALIALALFQQQISDVLAVIADTIN